MKISRRMPLDAEIYTIEFWYTNLKKWKSDHVHWDRICEEMEQKQSVIKAVEKIIQRLSDLSAEQLDKINTLLLLVWIEYKDKIAVQRSLINDRLFEEMLERQKVKQSQINKLDKEGMYKYLEEIVLAP